MMGRPKKDKMVQITYRIEPETAAKLRETAIECGFKYGDGAAMGAFLDRLAQVDRQLLKVILKRGVDE